MRSLQREPISDVALFKWEVSYWQYYEQKPIAIMSAQFFMKELNQGQTNVYDVIALLI